jgi:hypothetical protein
MGNGDKKDSLVDMYLHSGGVLGELIYAAKETLVAKPQAALRELLGGPEPEELTPPPPPVKPKRQSELKFKLHVMPLPIGLLGNSVTVYSEVTYRDVGPDGKPGWWPYPEKWITTLFQGQDHQGVGPFAMPLKDVQTYTVKLRARVDGGKTVSLASESVKSVCGASLPADPELRDLVCTLFSEGGSNPKFGDRELLAIAWTLRNRRDGLVQAQQSNDARNWKFFAARWYRDQNKQVPPITEPVTFARMIRAPRQFTGVGGREWDKCTDPMKNVTTRVECERVKKCVEIIDAVMVKNEPDPYAGKGNAKHPGVFYYKLHGNTPPHSGPMLPPLTNKDHHYYQGLDPEF